MAEQFSGLGPLMKPPETRNMIYSFMQLHLPLFPHWKISDLRREGKKKKKKAHSLKRKGHWLTGMHLFSLIFSICSVITLKII